LKAIWFAARSTLGAGAVLLLAILSGCQLAPETSDGAGPAFASTVHTGDPKVAGQLRSGFHGIEQNAWRWTAQEFSVVLHPPLGSAQAGAVLKVSLTIPDIVIQRLKTISLGGTLGGVSLPRETYSRPGSYLYQRDVPPDLLAHNVVQVDFQLDQSLAPTNGEQRQLGIIVSSIGLEVR